MSLLSSQPSSLLKKRTFNILRRSKPTTPIRGFYEPPAPTTVPILALVYPTLNKDVVDILPEALRKRKVIRIFSDIELKEQSKTDSFEADQLNYDNELYVVFRVGAWINVSGFSGYEAYAVLATADELKNMEGT